MSNQKLKSDVGGPSGTALDEGAGEGALDRLSALLPPDALDDALAGLAPEEITGPGGLITQLAGRVVEAALGAELSEHLGYPPGGAPPGGAGNHRNGSTPKTLKTELGEVLVRTPRDRQGSFEPRLVSKRQTRLAGLDERVLDLYAGGMSVRDIAEHLRRLYGVQVGRDTISQGHRRGAGGHRRLALPAAGGGLSDRLLRRAAHQDDRGPLGPHPRLLPGRRGHLRRRPRSARHLVAGREGSKFWLAVLNDLNRRGVADVLIACVDGLTGFPDAIEAVFPKAWVQTCIVHQIRASLRYVNYQDQRKVAAALRPVYRAANADAALAELEAFEAAWGERYPMIGQAWRERWEHIIPFLSLPEDLRRIVYTTNTIEAMHRQIRKAIKTRGHFPDEQAATKLIYLAIERAETKWRSARGWTPARRALKIHFQDRFPG